MPSFETADLHYGVVVNRNEFVSPCTSSGSQEEASTMSPLLLETAGTTEKVHSASIQAEHDRFEQEALELRRVKHSLCCLKILLACSLLPTVFWIAVLFQSVLGVFLVMGGLVGFYRHLSHDISANVVGTILLLNVASLYFCRRFELLDDWAMMMFACLDAGTLYQYYRHCHSKHRATPLADGTIREKELFFTYLGTIKSVANSVYNPPGRSHGNDNDNSQQSTELRAFYTSAPSEGFYSDSTGSQSLFLLFPPCESPKGWWIRGARKTTVEGRQVQSIVLEGFVSPTHEAYWTEGTLDGTENTLYYGKFVDKNSFTGEWLSYRGKRCHRYQLNLSNEADSKHHFGAVCGLCERNALPGTCFVAKDRDCYFCEGCVENDSSLVNEEEFVALTLPEVSRPMEDQHYAPPATASAVDLEVGAVQ